MKHTRQENIKSMFIIPYEGFAMRLGQTKNPVFERIMDNHVDEMIEKFVELTDYMNGMKPGDEYFVPSQYN